MKTHFLLALLCLFAATTGRAQQTEYPCATDILHEKALLDPAFKRAHEAQETRIYEHFSKSRPQAESGQALFTLPVVFHIVHQNGPENLTNADIQLAMQRLNDAFANLNYYNQGTGDDAMIQFCLARRTPNNLASTGVTRTQSPLTSLNYNTQDPLLKALVRWDPTQYVNVYVVGEIQGNVAGYAYYPSSHGNAYDGIVVEAEWMLSEPNIGVLAHEMGHYLGLMHTFSGGCTNNDCLLDGDRICDTPPDQSTAWTACNLVVNTCATDAQSGFSSDQPDMITNFMDYTDFNCFHDFTPGQSERMRWVIENIRESLLASKGCLDPCPNPVVAAFSGQSVVQAGQTLAFTNNSNNAVSYQWYVNGQPYSITPNISYQFIQEGQYNITLEAIPANQLLCSVGTFSRTVTATCPVVADFTVEFTNPTPGQTINVNNNSQNATSYEWFVDGLSQGNTLNSYTPLTAGLHIIRLEASNGFCTDLDYQYVIAREDTVINECAEFWIKSYGLPQVIENSGVIVAARDGGLFVSGSSNDSTLLMKLSADGAVIWQVALAPAAYGQPVITQLIEDSDGFIVGCGVSFNGGAGLFNGFTFKFNPFTLQLVWAHTNPSQPQTNYMALVEKSPGGNYIVFNSWHDSPPPGSFDDLNWIEISRNTGAFTNNKFAYSLGTSESAQEARVFNGQVYTSGRYTFVGSGFEGFRGGVTRFDLNGNPQSTYLYGSTQATMARNYATDFIIDSNRVITLIYGDFSGTDLFTNEFMIVVSNASTGLVINDYRYTLPNGRLINPRTLVKVDDGYVVFGYEPLPATGAYLIKLSLNFQVQWAWNYSNFYGFRAEKCLAFANGALYTTGEGGGDIRVMKIDPTTGLIGGNCPAPAPLNVTRTALSGIETAVILTQYPSPATQVVKQSAVRNTALITNTVCGLPCPVEICDNGIDDDGDNLADCLDPDCDCQACDGQQGRLWYFGSGAGLDFSTEPPTVLNNGQTFSREASAVISDALGNLLFYSDGGKAINRNHQIMPNGLNLNGHPSSSQMLIVPQPGKPWRNYVFTPSSFDVGPNTGVSYSVVDMTLDGGLGDVVPTEKNILLFTNYTEKVTATRHCNGIDWWVIIKTRPNNALHAFLLTENGLQAPVVSNAGSVNTNLTDVVGIMKFNPAGDILVNTLFHSGGFDLLRFDKSTGVFSSLATVVDLNAMRGAYGVEFSSDGDLLYISSLIAPSRINQFSLSNLTATAVSNSRVQIASDPGEYRFGQLQRAPNQRIYVTNSGPLIFTNTLGVINAPSIAGTGCNYVQAGQLTGSPGANIGLPSFPQDFFPKAFEVEITGPDTICQLLTTEIYTLEADVCSVDSIQWQVSGNANWQANGATTVQVEFNATGVYQITALVFSPCAIVSDTFTVYVDNSGNLTPDLGPDLAVCENGVRVLDPGAGFARYRWNDGTTEQTLTTLFPGTYWVDVWDSCNNQKSDTIVITVLPATVLDLGGDVIACPAITYTRPAPFTSWTWSPANGLNCTTCSPVTASPMGSQTYIVTAQTAAGCLSVDTFTITTTIITDTVSVDFCPGDVLVLGGQSFAPQGDTCVIVQIDGTPCDTTRLFCLHLQEQPTTSQTLFFCPGDTVFIGGVAYTSPGFAYDTLPASVGCDTIAEYVLRYAPIPTLNTPVELCPGDSVLLGGQYYSQPGLVMVTIPASTGCDTIANYFISILPQPTKTETIGICPGDSVLLGGQYYQQAGTVVLTLPASAGCDTIATYIISILPEPTTTRVVRFCPGSTVVIDGVTYNQPGTVQGVLPAAVGCDTLVTYLLQYANDGQTSVVNLDCPLNMTIDADPGSSTALVDYLTPDATTTCVCPGIDVTLTQGLPSGSLFPVGQTEVCYKAEDACGTSTTCCFTVTVEEQTACDIKTISCVKFELLGISQNAALEKTYRIRVTNSCAQPMIYFAAQLPNGLVAEAPADNSVYTAPSGREYLVRNPNSSPFHSVRYKSLADSIAGGQSDVFSYTLPPQGDPDYIQVMVRLKEQIYHSAHLNTFYCPVQFESAPPPAGARASKREVFLYPNPTDGQLFVDGRDIPEGALYLRVLDAQGRLMLDQRAEAQGEPLPVPLPAAMPGGLYVLELRFADGTQWVGRFVKE